MTSEKLARTQGRKKLQPDRFLGDAGPRKITVFRNNLETKEMPSFLMSDLGNGS